MGRFKDGLSSSDGLVTHNQVTINFVDTTTQKVYGKDAWSRDVDFSYSTLNAKGAIPAVGETWTLTRRHGYWQLDQVIDPIMPTITGSLRSVNGEPPTALVNLFRQLSEAGIIVDQTDSSSY